VKRDIVHDLREVECHSIKNLSGLLIQFCGKSLISKCGRERDWFDVSSLDGLVSFLNPEMGDVPNEDGTFSQSSESESSDESFLPGSKESPISLETDGDISFLSMTNNEFRLTNQIPASPGEDLQRPYIGDIPEAIGSDQSTTTQPQKKRRVHEKGCNTNQIVHASNNGSPLGWKSQRKRTPTNFYHSIT
jgi:hypothetical protein